MLEKENAAPMQACLLKDSKKPEGKKRQRSLHDIEDEYSEIISSSKRLKGQDDFQARSSYKVGVASLNCPQLDQ